MVYSIFTVGDRVQIKSGDFAGFEGIVSDPISPQDAVGTVTPRRQRMLLPVTVVALIDGRKLISRSLPECWIVSEF